MPRPPKPAASSSRLVPHLIRQVRARGGDADAFARRFGLPRDVEAREEAAISPVDFELLVESAGEALGDGCLAVHLAASIEHPSYSIPELAARASPTLREAMERVARYSSLFYAYVADTCEERDGEVWLTHRLRGLRAPAFRHSNEYALAAALHHARRLTGRPVSPSRVFFAHARPRDVEGLVAFFGTPRIAFDRPESGLAFAPEVAALRSNGDDPRLLATAEALAERALRERPPPVDFARTVARRLEQALSRGDASADAIAREMRLSPRTFQRRLAAEGTSFKDLLEAVRRDLARGWVREGSVTLTEIAYRLGYGDAAAFSRAFKRWTGEAPSAYRRTPAEP